MGCDPNFAYKIVMSNPRCTDIVLVKVKRAATVNFKCLNAFPRDRTNHTSIHKGQINPLFEELEAFDERKKGSFEWARTQNNLSPFHCELFYA